MGIRRSASSARIFAEGRAADRGLGIRPSVSGVRWGGAASSSAPAAGVSPLPSLSRILSRTCCVRGASAEAPQRGLLGRHLRGRVQAERQVGMSALRALALSASEGRGGFDADRQALQEALDDRFSLPSRRSRSPRGRCPRPRSLADGVDVRQGHHFRLHAAVLEVGHGVHREERAAVPERRGSCSTPSPGRTPRDVSFA